jgi:hypothetical protein
VTTQTPPAASDNAAWVTLETPLAADALATFCTDVEHIYRINPYFEFRFWREVTPARWHAAYRNLSNNTDADLEMTLTRASACNFEVVYSRGIKRRTRFYIQPAPAGSVLSIIDDYGDVAREQADREADRSLHAWGVALHEYLSRHARWQWCAPWRWYMRRVWTPMKPSARRVTYIILLIALAELALFALVMAIWWAESRT